MHRVRVGEVLLLLLVLMLLLNDSRGGNNSWMSGGRARDGSRILKLCDMGGDDFVFPFLHNEQ